MITILFQVSHKLLKEKLLNATVAADEEYVTVKANFQPLDLDSMSAFSKKRNEHGGVSAFLVASGLCLNSLNSRNFLSCMKLLCL